jgi:predicted RNA-binding Zn ribbon-like protein
LLDVRAADGQPLFIELVNTLHWHEGAPIELIGTDADFSAWLIEHGLPAQRVTASLLTVHRLRGHLRAITERLPSGGPHAEPDMAALRTALAAPSGHLTLICTETPQPHLAFGREVSNAVLCTFQVALSLATFLESDNLRRLKVCPNPGCGFAFVDTSANATRRWCGMRYCGNRLKVRAFRSRSRQQRYLPTRPGPRLSLVE